MHSNNLDNMTTRTRWRTRTTASLPLH